MIYYNHFAAYSPFGYFFCPWFYCTVLFMTELEESQAQIRRLEDDMESFKREQLELEEQRRQAEELRRQYEESASLEKEEKERLVKQI